MRLNVVIEMENKCKDELSFYNKNKKNSRKIFWDILTKRSR